MPLPLVTNKATVVPNAVYAPTIQIMCHIVNGKLKVGAMITIAAAKCENAGEANETWTAVGKSETVVIADIMNLPNDLSAYSTDVQQLFGLIVTLIGNINNVRQIL